MLNQPVEVELANHAVVGQDWLLDVLDLVAVTIVVEDVVRPNTDTVGHFPPLTSCGIWDQGGEF